MRRGLPMALAIILSEKVKTACDVAGASRSESGEAPFAQKAMKPLPTQGRSATAWIAATMLAMTWASETQSYPDHARHLTRDGCPQLRFRWNSGLWRLRALAAGQGQQRQIAAGCASNARRCRTPSGTGTPLGGDTVR